MTPDSTLIPVEIPANVPSTAGMTTKVVKGSLWTLSGQILPLFVSVITTPFVIRMLGAEGYGVLILVGLIPTYFAFADFGMSLASTKFASEAYAAGDLEKEAQVVRTAALIAFLASLPVAALIFIFSATAAALFNVPEHLQPQAALALKISSATFVINFLNAVFNTPQLTRLRMDLNTFVNSGIRVFGTLAVPFVIYYGGGIVGAVTVLLITSVAVLIGHLIVSGRLLGELFGFSLDSKAFRPLLKFGGGLVISGIAAVLLVNLEKLVLTRMTSVETLAHYSVAFTFASMATLFSGAMLQSLIPAFSQLLAPDKRLQLESLFSRALRANVIGMLPVLTFLFVIARPLFTVWAGEEFGRESTLPFYILLGGLFFNILAYVPVSLIMASGRTDLLAKLYWIELFPYIGLIAVLTLKFGAAGAALAWSIRVIADAVLMGRLSKQTAGISFYIFKGKAAAFGVAIMMLLPPVIVSAATHDLSIWPFLLLPASIALYCLFAWKKFLDTDERLWLTNKFQLAFRS